jgi:CrcB protein
MKSLVLIFVGGGLGSVTRFLLGKWINYYHFSTFPFATLIINVIACLILGCVVGLADRGNLISSNARLFWTVGFCGGFSTFSTFSNETLTLIQTGFTISAIGYSCLSVVLCLAATFIGLALSHF